MMSSMTVVQGQKKIVSSVQVSVQCDGEEYQAKDNIRHGRGSQCSQDGEQGHGGGGAKAGPGDADVRDVPHGQPVTMMT
jgi:hypothetical protein